MIETHEFRSMCGQFTRLSIETERGKAETNIENQKGFIDCAALMRNSCTNIEWHSLVVQTFIISPGRKEKRMDSSENVITVDFDGWPK